MIQRHSGQPGARHPGGDPSQAGDRARSALAALAQRVARDGDEAAFETLHRRLGRAIHRFFSQRSGARPDVIEDLSQQTWVEIWRALREGRYDPSRSAVSTFVYAVAYKLWIQHLRRANLDRGRSRGTGGEVLGPDALVEDFIGDAVDLGDLLAALDLCKQNLRDTRQMTLSEQQIIDGIAQGRSERELADALNVAHSTVNARKKSAYSKLRRCLQSKGFGAFLPSRA